MPDQQRRQAILVRWQTVPLLKDVTWGGLAYKYGDSPLPATCSEFIRNSKTPGILFGYVPTPDSPNYEAQLTGITRVYGCEDPVGAMHQLDTEFSKLKTQEEIAPDTVRLAYHALDSVREYLLQDQRDARDAVPDDIAHQAKDAKLFARLLIKALKPPKKPDPTRPPPTAFDKAKARQRRGITTSDMDNIRAVNEILAKQRQPLIDVLNNVLGVVQELAAEAHIDLPPPPSTGHSR